jgi:hypothetical protein
MSFLWASPSLRVCVPPTGHESPPIQIGLAELPGPLSRVRFELFKKWLEDCDENHLECRREDGLFQPSLEAPETPEMPTRLIDVSNPNGALLRLRIFPPGYRPGNEDTRYLALSHCLRRPSTQRFWTTAMNVGSRAYNGFYSSSLPPTFQHAITATQRLGIRYLWIDALCIIQEGDGLADLRRETARIGTVFRNAYSMLAASAATSCDDGFLLPAPGPPTPIIKLRFSPGRVVEDHIVYVAKNEDNFYEDVELAPLSHCAWALQERLLARRTIHFSARQAYFECSQGVRCETLTLLQSNKGPRLFSDPDFPRQLLSTPRPTRVSTIQSLFALYARLDFTMPTDRAVCLAGLESRLASVLGTRCTFGIMEEFLQRCLLWRRTRAATVGTSVKRIPYDKHTPVPSWSWMGCEGEIIFLKIDTALVEWNSSLQLVIPEAREVDAKGSKPVLRAQVLPFQSGCGLEQEGETSWFVFANKRMSGESGWLMWDRRPVREVPDLDEHQVVVVGRKRMGIEALIPGSRAKQRYYVLIVTPVKAGGEGWERVGVGWVPGGCIYFKGDEQERDVV